MADQLVMEQPMDFDENMSPESGPTQPEDGELCKYLKFDHDEPPIPLGRAGLSSWNEGNGFLQEEASPASEYHSHGKSPMDEHDLDYFLDACMDSIENATGTTEELSVNETIRVKEEFLRSRQNDEEEFVTYEEDATSIQALQQMMGYLKRTARKGKLSQEVCFHLGKEVLKVEEGLLNIFRQYGAVAVYEIMLKRMPLYAQLEIFRLESLSSLGITEGTTPELAEDKSSSEDEEDEAIVSPCKQELLSSREQTPCETPSPRFGESQPTALGAPTLMLRPCLASPCKQERSFAPPITRSTSLDTTASLQLSNTKAQQLASNPLSYPLTSQIAPNTTKTGGWEQNALNILPAPDWIANEDDVLSEFAHPDTVLPLTTDKSKPIYYQHTPKEGSVLFAMPQDPSYYPIYRARRFHEDEAMRERYPPMCELVEDVAQVTQLHAEFDNRQTNIFSDGANTLFVRLRMPKKSIHSTMPTSG
ncbi:hypothetical protein BT69DRAFT_356302 [Atractiella rhizophila]|nr:hypothetical protein BT69DRAFT_356302 [Atractiella rhizophila]